MPLFLDACALAKRYMHEGASSRRMKEITSRFADWGGFVVSSMIEPEVISAFAKFARNQPVRQHRDHYLSQHPNAVEAFRRDLSKQAFTIISVTDSEVEGAAKLLTDFPTFSIGAADAIHLVTALKVREQDRSLVFVSADKGLVEAAKVHRLLAYNPDMWTVEQLEQIVVQASAKAAE